MVTLALTEQQDEMAEKVTKSSLKNPIVVSFETPRTGCAGHPQFRPVWRIAQQRE